MKDVHAKQTPEGNRLKNFIEASFIYLLRLDCIITQAHVTVVKRTEQYICGFDSCAEVILEMMPAL